MNKATSLLVTGAVVVLSVGIAAVAVVGGGYFVAQLSGRAQVMLLALVIVVIVAVIVSTRT